MSVGRARRPMARIGVRAARTAVAGVAALVAIAALVVGPARAAVSLRAWLTQPRVAAGETTTLVVVVNGSGVDVGEPRVAVPDGIEVLGTSRSQSYAWSNGRASTQTTFRVELGADRPGTFAIGPIRVRLASQWYESRSVAITVTSTRESVPSSGAGPASLLTDVSPRDPYVGQPVILRIRLVQRAALAEEPQYTPPATPGFWSERGTAPETYYTDQAGSRVLVTETRSRLYPLAAGTQRIGEANAVLTLTLPLAGRDPFSAFGGARRQIAAQSAPIGVAVRPLPAGAPAEFDGAVGRFTTSWWADRSRTTLDVPVTVWLDVRGSGNLPLLRTPALTCRGAEVFSSTVQDSLGAPGVLTPGRRRFQWTVLARNVGPLRLDPPPLAWFDYASGRYERLDAPPVEVEVLPPLRAPGGGSEALPVVFVEHPLDPFARPANPWGFAAAGVLLGVGLRGLLTARRRRLSESAPSPAWLEGLRHTRGTAFWAAAARACDELWHRGVDVSAWRREVERARYGGEGISETPVRQALLGYLTNPSAGGAGDAARIWAMTAAAMVPALVLVVLSLPRGGDAAAVKQCLRADRAASAGDLDAAGNAWRWLWRHGARHPGLAARLAWAGERLGAIADASAWVLRGDAVEPRDATLDWVTAQVRDAGGLTGFRHQRVPVRALEWALAALACGLGIAWAGRRTAIGLALLAVLIAAGPGIDRWRASRALRAVVRAPVVLEGEGVELVSGQVVRLRDRSRGRSRVEVGSGIQGWVPTAVLDVTGGVQ